MKTQNNSTDFLFKSYFYCKNLKDPLELKKKNYAILFLEGFRHQMNGSGGFKSLSLVLQGSRVKWYFWTSDTANADHSAVSGSVQASGNK